MSYQGVNDETLAVLRARRNEVWLLWSKYGWEDDGILLSVHATKLGAVTEARRIDVGVVGDDDLELRYDGPTLVILRRKRNHGQYECLQREVKP